MKALPLFPATLAGSLPKPSWLAEPEKLWAPWKLEGDALKEGQMAFFVAIDDIATGVDSNVRTFQEDREKFVRALREAAAVAATGS